MFLVSMPRVKWWGLLTRKPGITPVVPPPPLPVMKTSEAGCELIKSFEKLELKAYQDTGGVWTVGWGHTGPDVKESTWVDPQGAERLFQEDVSWAEGVVDGNITVPLEQYQYDALVSFVFNIGAYQFRTSTLVKKLNQKKYDEVPGELRRWVYDEHKVEPGLVKRRDKEATLFEKGIYENNK